MASQHFCHNCGSPASQDASFCLQCGASLQSASEGKCPQCGQENDLNDQFCGACGTPLTAASVGSSNAPNYSPSELPMVSFGEAISLGFKKSFTYSGRARRSELWWWVLFSVLVGSVPVVGLISVFLWIPAISLTARRLHDLGLSGWWQVTPWAILVLGVILGSAGADGLFVVALVFWLLSGIALFVMWIRKGNLGPNKYGPDPRQSGSN